MGREKKAKDMKGKLLNVPHWDSIYMTWGEANPPADGRSVCKYLEEESETDGMRVYIDVAFGLWVSFVFVLRIVFIIRMTSRWYLHNL